MLSTTASALAAPVIAAIPAPVVSEIPFWPRPIQLYALCLIAGAVAAFVLGSRRWKARGGHEGAIIDVGIIAVVFGIVGARLYHVVSSPDAYFGPGFDGTGDPIKILYIWNGGLGIWGAIALGAVGAWLACRIHGIRFSAFADVVAPGILLAQAIGRLGNYFNQELFGGPTEAPWGLTVDPDHANFPAGYPADTLFHPTFLYEMIWSLIGVALLLLLDRRFQLRRGMMVWAYVAWYTLGRTWIEMLRIDDAQMITLFGLEQRLNVWTSLAVFVLALAFLVYLWVTRPRSAEDRAAADAIYVPGRERGPDGEESTSVSSGSSESADSTDSSGSLGSPELSGTDDDRRG